MIIFGNKLSPEHCCPEQLPEYMDKKNIQAIPVK
jgi:hypothetical protein